MKSVLTLLLFLIIGSVIADTLTHDIKVYRDPDCQCCHKWITHLENNQFNVIDVPTRNMASVKAAIDLPKGIASCHTATIGGYIIEGHVPVADIIRLLTEKPDIAGLSVPQMPVGSPGMEMGSRKDNFAVMQFDRAGHYSVYNYYFVDEHNEYQSKKAEATQ
ncbi:MAG: DUF411 domain-containing protein [Gammaproteobacteria bacterium]|nr:DUF411 domain-containing protein [Gammaproteobacteria bacterium]